MFLRNHRQSQYQSTQSPDKRDNIGRFCKPLIMFNDIFFLYPMPVLMLNKHIQYSMQEPTAWEWVKWYHEDKVSLVKDFPGDYTVVPELSYCWTSVKSPFSHHVYCSMCSRVCMRGVYFRRRSHLSAVAQPVLLPWMTVFPWFLVLVWPTIWLSSFTLMSSSQVHSHLS